MIIFREDTSTLFLEPVSTHVAPDYYEMIKTPMSFYDIKNKIFNCEYKSDEEFWVSTAITREKYCNFLFY